VREQPRPEPGRLSPAQAEVSGLAQGRSGVRVRVLDSIGGVAQVMRGREAGVHARRAPGQQAGQGISDGIGPGVGDRLGYRARHWGSRVRRSYSFGVMFPPDVGTGGLRQPSGHRGIDPLARFLPGLGVGQVRGRGRGEAGAGQGTAAGAARPGLGDADGEARQRIGGDRDREVPAAGHGRRFHPVQPGEPFGQPGRDGRGAADAPPAGVPAGEPERDRGDVRADLAGRAGRGGAPGAGGADGGRQGPVQVAGDHMPQGTRFAR
jgi:hypothetical protein